MTNEYKGVSGIMAFVFYKDVSDTGTADTDLDIFLAGGFADDDGRPVMAFDGAVVGMSCQHHVAVGSGHAGLVKVTRGTTDLCSESLVAAADTAQYHRYDPSLYPVSAGDMLKVSVQSDQANDDFGETTVVVYVQVGQSSD